MQEEQEDFTQPSEAEEIRAEAPDEPIEAQPEAQEANGDKADPRISKLNRENATLRRRAKEAEEALKVREQADLSESERHMNRIAELEGQLKDAEASNREVSLRAAVVQGCASVGIVDPDAALALVDRGGLEFADGRWLGVDEALAALAADKPYLVGSSANAANHNPTNPARRRSTLDTDALRDMTPEQIASLSWEEIDAATGR